MGSWLEKQLGEQARRQQMSCTFISVKQVSECSSSLSLAGRFFWGNRTFVADYRAGTISEKPCLVF